MISQKNLIKSKIQVFAFLLFGVLNILQTNAESIYFRSIPAEAGLSQLSVSCIFQDSKGFLWFGTRNGLNRYDGHSFEVFRNDDTDSSSISNNNITSIVEDRSGNLWIGTEHGLNCYSYTSNKFIHFFKSSGNNGISHNKVGSLHYDKKGRLWVGTEQGLNLYNPNKRTFTKTTLDGILYNNRILSLSSDSYGNIWIGTLNSGLIQYNPESQNYKDYLNNAQDESSLSNNTVRTIFEDSGRNLWVGTKTGLCMFDAKNNTFKHFGKDIYKGEKLSNEGIRCITEDQDKNLLIGTNEGFNILNKKTRKVSIYNPSKSGKGNLNHFYIYSIYTDKAGTVWLGTFMGGINFYNKSDQQFQFSNPGNLEHLVYGGVGPMIEAGKEFWIGTGGGGLFSYDTEDKKYSRFMIEDFSYVSNVIKALYIQGDNLFISTEQSRFLIFDTRRKKIVKSLDISKNQITNIYPDTDGKLFLCVRDSLGLRLYDPKTSQVNPFKYQNPNDERKMLFPYATCVEKENDSIFWIGTRYVGLYRYNRNTNTAERFNRNNNPTLTSNNISVITSDSRNNLWVGTDGGGLWVYNKVTGKFKTYGEKEGLSNGTILAILPDNSGFLWISTLTGLSKFDPVTGRFKNFVYGNGFPLQEPSENSFLKLADGRLCFGGNNGMVIFNPQEILTNNFIPPLIITDFNLLRSDQKKQDQELQQKLVKDGTSIRLKYNQSSFTIQYSALNYIFPEKNQYAYKLEGFDHDWNMVGQQRIAIYTNLHSGNYRFRLKASNNDGIWNEKYITLNIKVLPPPWFSWYAYIFYLLLFAGLTFSMLRFIKLENKIKLSQMAQENIEKVHQLRIRMFTNFSHELRTPLTLIIGPLEDLLNRTDIGQTVRQSLSMIQKNAQRLLLITNQLMDFRKQESGKMQLRAAEGNFSEYMKEISLAFSELARKQNIRYSFNTRQKVITLWFDRQLLEKVFFNLLSNAFKNTPSGGEISILVEVKARENLKGDCYINFEVEAEEYVEITVTDNGKGISNENLGKIFDPFYQVSDNTQTGTGIGLSLSKGIAELHYGTIGVESKQGEGAIFKVLLPRGKKHLQDKEIMNDFKDEESLNHYMLPLDENDSEDEIVVEVNHELHTILIVEDNPDVRSYIKKHLKETYNLIEAVNGEEGFSKAVSEIPDLIISDVMMPGMNGLEMCCKLKSELNTCHIPIILLTALTTFRQIKEGFEVGSDDYILKPFNSELLKLKVNNLIANRERLKKAFSKKFPFEMVNTGSGSFDEKFLDKIYAIMDKKLSDSEFDLDAFSEEIGMSRANLYRKIKALTNFAPNELLKNYRLKASVQLLMENRYSVSEISYMVGFSTPAYFSNCFKKTYQLSPSEYYERNSRGYTNCGEG